MCDELDELKEFKDSSEDTNTMMNQKHMELTTNCRELERDLLKFEGMVKKESDEKFKRIVKLETMTNSHENDIQLIQNHRREL